MRVLLHRVSVVLVEPDKFVGPAGLRSLPFLADTRDRRPANADNLEESLSPFRCHHHELRGVCPKGLNPTKAINKIKEMLVKRSV